MKKTINIIKKYWPDPVWSKVIASIIFSIIAFIFLLLKAIISGIPFKTVLSNLWNYLSSYSQINNALIIVFVLLSIYGLYFAMKPIYRKYFLDKKQPKEKIEPNMGMDAAPFFHLRVTSAFPGLRGYEIITKRRDINKRLRILLKEPLSFNPISNPSVHPLYWYRGTPCNSIESFKKIGCNKWLLNNEELKIAKIIAYHSNVYYQDFVYIETKSDKQTGLYKISKEDINHHIKEFGYSWEEFGLLNRKYLNRRELDDGAAKIHGKIIDARKAQLRVRYISPYNFIISSHESPINNKKFDKTLESLLNELLNNENIFPTLIDEISKLPKKGY